jgi:serine/threonine-protein kinase PpkA
MRLWKPLVRALTVLVGASILLGPVAVDVAAAERQALTMPGKTSLYQRVLTRPGAALRGSPAADAPRGAELSPLSLYYVYERRQVQGSDWVELGTAVADAAAGWLPAGEAIDWRQTLTLAFTRNANREPALFFGDRAALLGLLESEGLVPETERLRATIREGRIPDGFPVIAKEPDTYVDPNRQFYLLPILGHEQVFLESGLRATLLEVAAVTLQAGAQDLLAQGASDGGGPTQASDGTAAGADYRAGVVFVVDSTSSMGPYIERTRAAVRRIYDRLKGSPLGDALSFGLVAFRDNTEATPGLEYVSRVAATLEDGRDPSGFFARVSRVEAAQVSSRGFNEDAFAGIYDALESIDWRGYAGRFIVLITDAGARDANDPLARTGLGAERLRLLAQDKDQSAGGGKIAIAALHLLTPEGRQTHRLAATQYRTLTHWGTQATSIFPLRADRWMHSALRWTPWPTPS